VGNLRIRVNRRGVREGDKTLELAAVAQAEKIEPLLKVLL
jgi:hypothetical protein